MAYLVTGGTGFIGRFLVQRLLDERAGDIHVLVRDGSEGKLERFGSERVKPVRGDLTEERLGIDPAWIAEHAVGPPRPEPPFADKASNGCLSCDGCRHRLTPSPQCRCSAGAIGRAPPQL